MVGDGGVAPLAGAWIEIILRLRESKAALVAPLAGAWIEIGCKVHAGSGRNVAPLAGAWIEIRCTWNQSRDQRSRSPRGSVD